MRIRENLGGLVASTSKLTPLSATKPQIGKVYGIVLDQNTPSKELFEKVGGWNGIGTVFYLDYEQSKNIPIDQVNLSTCKTAKPFYSSIQDYPLKGELISIIDAPSPTSQINNSAAQKYYTGTINLWNNNQQNSLTDDALGKTFTEKADIRNLYSFEGDRIYQGRKGNGIRFGSTVKLKSNINEWSSVGKDGDPITILVNGYITTDTGSSVPNVEEINKELSSIYLTSTQKLPLTPGSLILNPLYTPIPPNKYFEPQIILNSDRLVFNSKKDDILLYSSGFIELNTDSITNINSGTLINLNSPIIWLGVKKDGTEPTEPLLLGNKVKELLNSLLSTLETLGNNLSSVVVSPEGSPLAGVNVAGASLTESLLTLHKQLKDITSNTNFTV